jgi:hypothetical protein
MNSVTAGSSTWLRLYAAEPTPLSAVCLNQDGSLEASDAAMSSLDFSVSSPPGASGVARGERAEFSAATIERGRRPLEDLERCCHDNAPDRADGVGDSLPDIALDSRGARGLDVDGVACLSRLEGVVTADFSGLIERARSDARTVQVSVAVQTAKLKTHQLSEPPSPLCLWQCLALVART